MGLSIPKLFLRHDGGSVSIIAAVALPMLVGFVALVAEYGHGVLNKGQDQRIADLSAYAGALAYAASSSTTVMTNAAQALARLNGVDPAGVTVSLVASPRTAGAQAVSVAIATSNLLLIAPVLGAGSSLPIRATAYAELNSATPCIIATSTTGRGITLSGGAAVSAPACSVASNAAITVPCGTTLSVKAVSYDSAAAPVQPCGGITAAGGGAVPLNHGLTADPLAANAGVAAATAHIASVAALTAPAAPPTTFAVPVTFGYLGVAAILGSLPAGCLVVGVLGNYTVICAFQPSYTFGPITVYGGVTVNFNINGSAATTYTINGPILNQGTLNLGPGTYNVSQGIENTGGATMTFAAGTFNIGRYPSACSGGGGLYSLCNLGTSLTFGNPSVIALSSGLYNAGGSTLTLGAGSSTANSFQIGASSDGNALTLGGGAKTTFGDALASSSLFQFDGNLNDGAGGGGCLTLGASAQHDINGFVSLAGGTTLGAGIYTVNGSIAFGANGGGDVSCNGATVGVSGSGVTLVTSGASTVTGSSCSGASFCVSSGYSNVVLSAPTTGTTANLVVIGPTAASQTSGAVFTGGASNTTLAGAFYYPNGPVSLGGAARVGGGTSQCLELIGSQVTLSGGSAAASACFSGSAGTKGARLVQ